MKRAVRVLFVAVLVLATVVGFLTVSVTHAVRRAHDELRATGRLPPANLARTLVALQPHPFGTSSPVHCTLAQVLHELTEDIRYGPHINFCGALDCWAPVPNGAAAEVLDRAGISATPLPLTLTAEVAYRLAPSDMLVELYADAYLRRHDLRALAEDYLGIELEQASSSELLFLMARAETADICESLANPDIVRFKPEPSCNYYVAERLEELEERLARAGHPLRR